VQVLDHHQRGESVVLAGFVELGLHWTYGWPTEYWGMAVVLMEQPHIFTMLSSMTYMKDRWNKETDYAK
jgi:hypothetical protein